MITDKRLSPEQERLVRSVGMDPKEVNLIVDNDQYIVLLHLKSGCEITIYRRRKLIC